MVNRSSVMNIKPLSFVILAGIAVLSFLTSCVGVGAAAPMTYYVDSVAGSNEQSGHSPKEAWADFTPVNGKTLKAGERLLIKRGSVINQELQVGARGTAEAWVEIGAYGEGSRPSIRRNWDIHERCAYIKNPDYLRVSGLMVSYAGQGFVVRFTRPRHGNLLVEDCVAHHIEGIYREMGNLSGIPSWKDFKAPTGSIPRSGGIMVNGRSHDVTVRNCDIFQTSWGFVVSGGERVILDAVNVHDCYVFNTSCHPSLQGVTSSVMENCVFDASGYHAFAGTMGIMLGGPQNLTIQNCTFKNQPDSDSHDQGGLDFEATGDGALIDHCTFENNAGPGIEVLGLTRPQPINVEIRNSRFIKNSSETHKFPTEIYVFGHPDVRDPKIECSTGVIHNNGYVLNPGVQFFQNCSTEELTDWKLWGNTEYSTVEAIKKAMPRNDPPEVDTGENICTVNPVVQLNGSVSDDGKPESKKTAVQWDVLEGPGSVQFSDASAAKTTATFSKPGEYMLRLKGHDGELWVSDLLYVAVLEPNTTLVKGWEFNENPNKEGWTEESLGETGWEIKDCGVAEPVKYVGGGYYIVVAKDTSGARLVSPNGLGLAAGKGQFLEIRMQNHTSAKQMKLRFSPANGVPFDVVPNDKQMRVYRVDLSKVDGWKGTIDQLRLEVGAGEEVTGTMRVDYVRLLGGEN